MMNRAEWRHRLLADQSLPGGQRTAVFRAFGGWEVAESGPPRPDGGMGRCDGVDGAKWNILNTTQFWPGCTNYNDVPVRNYKTFTDGIAATLATLHNGNYQAILDAIADPGASAEDVLRAVATTEWGTSLDGLLGGLSTYMSKKAYYNGLDIGV